jgi:hypothetical protein
MSQRRAAASGRWRRGDAGQAKSLGYTAVSITPALSAFVEVSLTSFDQGGDAVSGLAAAYLARRGRDGKSASATRACNAEPRRDGA